MDKIDKILHLVDNPGEYSPEEVDRLLADPEMRKLYETLSAASSALHASEVAADEEETDAEWCRFSRQHRFSAWRSLWRQRRAAVITAVVASSLVAVGMGIGFSVYHSRSVKSVDSEIKVMAVDEASALPAGDSSIIEPALAVADLPASVEFEDETLETILGRIAEAYGLEVRYLSDAPKTIRLYFVWQTAMTPAETIASLDNFERFSASLDGATIIVE